MKGPRRQRKKNSRRNRLEARAGSHATREFRFRQLIKILRGLATFRGIEHIRIENGVITSTRIPDNSTGDR